MPKSTNILVYSRKMGEKMTKYKSIYLNISRAKYADLIEWIEKKANEEDRTLNSLIIRLLKQEFEKDGKKEKA